MPPLHGDIIFDGGTPLTGATPVLSINWTVIRGAALAYLAIPVPLLFWRLLPVPHLFPCSLTDWTRVFCNEPRWALTSCKYIIRSTNKCMAYFKLSFYWSDLVIKLPCLSICLCHCLRHRMHFFSRPLIGAEVTWSVPGLSLHPPPSTKKFIPHPHPKKCFFMTSPPKILFLQP